MTEVRTWFKKLVKAELKGKSTSVLHHLSCIYNTVMNTWETCGMTQTKGLPFTDFGTSDTSMEVNETHGTSTIAGSFGVDSDTLNIRNFITRNLKCLGSSQLIYEVMMKNVGGFTTTFTSSTINSLTYMKGI